MHSSSHQSDFVFLFADYSQIEVRLIAHYSKDPILIDSYEKEQDVHTRTMCEMFNYDYDEVYNVLDAEDKKHPLYSTYKDYRKVAKILNFGIVYQVSAMSLAEQIKRPERFKDLSDRMWSNECQKFIDAYFRKYKHVRRFINAGNKAVTKHAKLVNFFGRERHLEHANAVRITKDNSNYWMEGRAQRQGVNFLIQSTAADLFKISVVRVAKLLEDYQSYIVNFVHDEIQIYLHKQELHLLPEIKSRMEDFEFDVPITVDFEYSERAWGEKQHIRNLIAA